MHTKRLIRVMRIGDNGRESRDQSHDFAPNMWSSKRRVAAKILAQWLHCSTVIATLAYR